MRNNAMFLPACAVVFGLIYGGIALTTTAILAKYNDPRNTTSHDLTVTDMTTTPPTRCRVWLTLTNKEKREMCWELPEDYVYSRND